MSANERTAWISFLVMAVAGGAYLAYVIAEYAGGRHPDPFMLVLCIVAQIVGHAVLHGLAAARGATYEPADERDRLIELKATRAAFFAVVAGVLTATATLHLGAGAIELAYAVLAALIIAELVRSGGQIVAYRRG